MMQPHSMTGILIAAIVAWLFGAAYYTLLAPRWLAAQGKTVAQHKAELAAQRPDGNAGPVSYTSTRERVRTTAARPCPTSSTVNSKVPGAGVGAR